MEDYAQVYKTIMTEITQDDPEIRECYLKEFRDQTDKFTEGMSDAFLNWRTLDATIHGDKKRGYVSGMVYNAIILHILSIKLFLAGYIVASGNLERQVLESIALACLFSSKTLDVLDRYMRDEYSPNKAVRDVLRHAKTLNLKRDALEILQQVLDFYHKYSHPSKLTIASHISFSEQGLYVGASFDENKVKAYAIEVNRLTNLADIFSNFIDGVKENLAKW